MGVAVDLVKKDQLLLSLFGLAVWKRREDDAENS
jgi:hypothetical protein